ncbi:hypothetical protein HY045_01310, partial [Candidatus Woesebacteria bacterium]|nr:hypothetical protein [Candidatus Woesebacteria bacterium]
MFKRSLIFIILICALAIPTFIRMVKPGMFTTQDFHFFRLFEFDKCFKDLQIPCRWAPDAGLGFGEPLFNFYGQLPYLFGEIIHISGFSLIDSLKSVFIFSLFASGVSMYFLAKRVWKDDLSSLISAIIYVYAPYRAVDVWVRGALPEALSFAIYPLILLSLDKFIDDEKTTGLMWFVLFLTALILTHNLSVLLFLPVILVWVLYRIINMKKYKLLLKIVSGFVLAGLLSSFYLIPVITEAKYINLDATTLGYFNFRGHYVETSQLLFSRFWGYGASVFGPEDGMSLAIGQIQWVIPVLTLLLILLKRKIFENKTFVILFLLGWFLLFMTHNKSIFLWLRVDYLKYIQFPWRFLAPATFVFTLASGKIAQLFSKYKKLICLIIVVITIGLNYSFFGEDIWLNVKDSNLTGGEEWVRQRSASIADYWPKFGVLPTEVASDNP